MVWGQWGYFASELKVIDQGNFTMEDIYLNRTNTWELLILHKYLIKIFLNICVRIPQHWKMWYVLTLHGWLAYFMYFQGKIKFKSPLCFYPVKRTIIWSKVEKTRLGRRTMYYHLSENRALFLMVAQLSSFWVVHIAHNNGQFGFFFVIHTK